MLSVAALRMLVMVKAATIKMLLMVMGTTAEVKVVLMVCLQLSRPQLQLQHSRATPPMLLHMPSSCFLHCPRSANCATEGYQIHHWQREPGSLMRCPLTLFKVPLLSLVPVVFPQLDTTMYIPEFNMFTRRILNGRLVFSVCTMVPGAFLSG